MERIKNILIVTYEKLVHRKSVFVMLLKNENTFSFLCSVFCFVFLRPVSCVPNVSLFYGCPFLIAPSVFSNIYLIYLILVQIKCFYAYLYASYSTILHINAIIIRSFRWSRFPFSKWSLIF